MDWKELLCIERPRKSTSTGDHRQQFERDFDRSVFSTPVKRLQDKAQVFPLDPCDAVRTRLTHSLEVSSVARGLAQAVGSWLLGDGKIEPGMDRSIEAIAATCGLIHDLGNPPFGHSGEDAIRDWFKSYFKLEDLNSLLEENEQAIKDFLHFEGNAQSLRLVSKLQVLADYHGLNLTYGTLSASCKYLAPSHQIDENKHSFSKVGYFASEGAIVAEMRKRTGTQDSRHPLCFIVEAADDIVYSAADVEDAVKKKVLTWDDVHHYLDNYAARDKTSIANAFELMDKILKPSGKTLKELPDDVCAAAFRTAAITVAVDRATTAFKDHYVEIMEGKYEGELIKDSNAADLVKALKTLGATRVYSTQSNLKLELMGRKVIGDLLSLFWEGARKLEPNASPKPKTFVGKIGALFSSNYRSVFDHAASNGSGLPLNYYRLQLVTDYVCGMTDSFAQRLHAELFNG